MRIPPKYAYLGSASAAALCLIVAVASARAVISTEQRLNEAELSLDTRDQFALASINSVFSRWNDLTLILARQSQPRMEWTYLIEELKHSLQQFVEDPRHHSRLPHQVALAKLHLGRICSIQGNNSMARNWIDQSIELSKSNQDQVLWGYALNTLGCLDSVLGDHNAAKRSFYECCRLLQSQHGSDHQNVLAIALRNLGLTNRALGLDATEPIRKAILIQQQDPDSRTYGLTNEMLQDLRMTLCEVYWEQGELQKAASLAQQTLDSLTSQIVHTELPNLDKHLIALNRYNNATMFAQRNLQSLRQIANDFGQTASRSELGKTASRWQWSPLVDLNTELVSNHLSMSGTMVAEFEPQNGLALAWGMFDWTNSVVTDIARQLHDRVRLVVVADNEESMEQAQASLEAAEVPLENIRFAIIDCETPWFRDQGPIVSVSSSGETIWFDSRLTREDRKGRIVLDALPNALRRNWRTRVADVPVHLEGGMLLSNGRGLTVASNHIIPLNQLYGFSDAVIRKETLRVTGAKQLVMIDTLMGEPTRHIDMFMTFVTPTTVVVGKYSDRNNPNSVVLDRVAQKLEGVIVDGKPLTVVRIPMPESQDDTFPTYTNVVFANGMLLVPSYQGQPQEVESQVKSIYSELLPDWEIRFVDCTRLRDRGGALHCMVSNLGPTEFTPVHPKKQDALSSSEQPKLTSIR
ncbi:agmatine deiminase family protein [Stieleria varia]|uniref:Agmatine deiminase n=1 Tax=Stieleria varia TaxID=2528005 RepID=A0A5C6B8A7_9BACT|nr:agmatine deiminase family protein [Stieleria varia]TWU07529.1 Agmatine deiminase [Stieleria varia]